MSLLDSFITNFLATKLYFYQPSLNLGIKITIALEKTLIIMICKKYL